MNHATKTGRTYGAVYAFLRTAGPTLGEFTLRDLSPAITPRQAHSAIRDLLRNGELAQLRPATPGRYGQPALYRFPSASPRDPLTA